MVCLATGRRLPTISARCPAGVARRRECDMNNEETFYQAMRRQGVTRAAFSNIVVWLPRRWD